MKITPNVVAAADQELADVDQTLDSMVKTFNDFEWAKNDRVFCISQFMAYLSPVVATHSNAIALLTVAIERLADE